MKNKVILCIVAFVIVGFVMVLLCTRLYLPCIIEHNIRHQRMYQ